MSEVKHVLEAKSKNKSIIDLKLQAPITRIKDISSQLQLCRCRPESECSRVSKLHDYQCEFCHGYVFKKKADMNRIYPHEQGWSSMINAVNELRQISGKEIPTDKM